MTIAEIKEIYNGKYSDIEIYEANTKGQCFPNHFHTDNCNPTENYSDNDEIAFVELMNENDYNNSILANSEISADFDDWYGNKDAMVLCVMLTW